MNKIKKILLAVDFGETTNLAVEKVTSLARIFNAEVIPVHAVEVAAYFQNSPVIDTKAIYDRIAIRMSEIEMSLGKSGVETGESVVRDGNALEIVLGVAKDLNVDLIVLGAGRKNVLERMLGATAEKIIRNCSQLAFAIHPGDSVREMKNVLCALDCIHASEITLNAAITFCRKLKAKLTILHVVSPSEYYPDLSELRAPISEWGYNIVPDIVSESSVGPDKIRIEKETKLHDYLKRCDLNGISYTYTIKSGNPEDEICEFVRETNSDLLVMGAVDRKEATLFFAKGTIEKLLRRVSCSILTVKHVESID